MYRRLLCLLASALLTACASNAPNPSGAPTVDLDVSAASAGYGQNTMFSFVRCDESTKREYAEKGEGSQTLLASFFFGNKGPKTIQVPVGSTLPMGTRYSGTVGASSRAIHMNNHTLYWSFAPIAGHRYAATSSGPSLSVTDAATNRPPTSLVRHTAQTICPPDSPFSKSIAVK